MIMLHITVVLLLLLT